MQMVSSRELGPTAGSYIVEAPLVSEVVRVGLNSQRQWSIWLKHKVDANRTRRLRITVAPIGLDVGDDEDLLGCEEVYGVWYAVWGFQLPD